MGQVEEEAPLAPQVEGSRIGFLKELQEEAVVVELSLGDSQLHLPEEMKQLVLLVVF